MKKDTVKVFGYMDNQEDEVKKMREALEKVNVFWKEHRYDAYDLGDGEEYNVFDGELDFVEDLIKETT